MQKEIKSCHQTIQADSNIKKNDHNSINDPVCNVSVNLGQAFAYYIIVESHNKFAFISLSMFLKHLEILLLRPSNEREYSHMFRILVFVIRTFLGFSSANRHRASGQY